MDSTLVKMHVFLDTCYEVESTSAEIYYLFAKQFKDDRKISRLWGKTAMEEENHARHVVLAKKMVESINWICLESWHNAAASLDMVKQFRNSVKEVSPTLRDAILMALKCEKSMLNLHMMNAILVKERVGNSMFKAMLRADQGHIEMLEAALDEVKKNNDEEELEIVDFGELDLMDVMELQPAAVK